MLNRKVKRIDKKQALQKLKHYCGYQERSHLEAKEKLYGFGLYKHEVEELLARLIEEDYLNEERFAVAYARGKFGMKGWGKVKIIQGLKEKRVSDYCIKRAMREIDKNQYATALHKLSARKWNSLNSEKNIFIKMRKTQNYLLQKGFEPGLVIESMHQLRSGQSEED